MINPVLQRIDSSDDVVFLENAIFQVNKGNSLCTEVELLLNTNVQCYVLAEDLETRGFIADDLITGINVIDYPELVKLTEKNKQILTWS